jgi:Flp pilus assembly protein TadD
LRTVHYIAIIAAVALTAVLFWAVPVTPSKDHAAGHEHAHEDAPMAGAVATAQPAALDSIAAASLAALPAHAASDLKDLDTKIAQQPDSATMAPLYEQAAAIWREHHQPAMYAWTSAQAARLSQSEKKLTFAGQFFIELMQDAGSPAMQAWAAQQAIGCLNRALELNPDDDTARIALATAYVEGTGAPMSGISILREMVAKNPDHAAANLLLGRLSIQSGQWEKAVERLEHVRNLEPKNREALYFLGEAYRGAGQKEKAIATFRQLEALVNKPEFTRDIESYISTFK